MGKITAKPIVLAFWRSYLFWLVGTGFGILFAVTAEERFVDLSGYLKLINWGAVLAGGFMAGFLAQRHGAWYGGLTGCIWGIFWLGLMMIVAPQSWPLSVGNQLFMTSTVLSAAAGVCGVNLYHAFRKEPPVRRNLTLRQ
jgi:thiamine transporter ThiT